MDLLHDRLVTLKGAGQCVLTLDLIAPLLPDDPSVRIEDANAQHEVIWARIDTIVQMRELYPGVPVYGLWQTVLHSRVVDLHDYDVLVYRTESGTDGAYCAIKDGRAVAADQFFYDLPSDVASARSFEITSALLSQLSAPRRAFFLPQEVKAEFLRKTRRMGLACGAGLGLAGLALFGVDTWLAKQAKTYLDQAAALDVKAAAIEEEARIALTRSDPILPAQRLRWHAGLTRLVEAASKSGNATLDPTDFSTATQINLRVARLPTDLSFPTVATVTPGSPLAISFSLDGTSP